jgi:hypothetical protein
VSDEKSGGGFGPKKPKATTFRVATSYLDSKYKVFDTENVEKPQKQEKQVQGQYR